MTMKMTMKMLCELTLSRLYPFQSSFTVGEKKKRSTKEIPGGFIPSEILVRVVRNPEDFLLVMRST